MWRRTVCPSSSRTWRSAGASTTTTSPHAASPSSASPSSSGDGEAHEARRGALTGFAFRGAARVLLEYAAFLSRLGLNTLAVKYTALASETAESVVVGGGTADEALTELEAAQLVVQLARLQERKEVSEQA